VQRALALLDAQLGLGTIFDVRSRRTTGDSALLRRTIGHRATGTGRAKLLTGAISTTRTRRTKLLSTVLCGPHGTGTHYPHPRIDGGGRLQLGDLRSGQGAATIGTNCLLLPLE